MDGVGEPIMSNRPQPWRKLSRAEMLTQCRASSVWMGPPRAASVRGDIGAQIRVMAYQGLKGQHCRWMARGSNRVSKPMWLENPEVGEE